MQEVVMGSTAQYWRTVWWVLESQFRLHLAQAKSNRARRGRKNDYADARRLVRRLVPRLGYNKAIWAAAHRVCRLIWKILHRGCATSNTASESVPR